MSIRNFKDCTKCENFILSASGRGCCKVGRNNVESNRSCPYYKKSESFYYDRQREIFKNFDFLAIASLISGTILTIIMLIFGLYFVVTVLGLSYLSAFQKSILFFIASVTIFLMIYVMFSLAKHFISARCLQLIFTFAVVILVMLNYETIWFSFHMFVVSIIELLFKA